MANISFETSENDSDFQLFYGLTNDDFGISLLTYREPGKDGYFLLMVSPKDDVAERELVNKDIVFVLDTSGSMSEAGKMEKARAALALKEKDANKRPLLEQQQIRRGRIHAADGTVIAKSIAKGKGSNLRYVRRYPEGPLYGHPIGYSFV